MPSDCDLGLNPQSPLGSPHVPLGVPVQDFSGQFPEPNLDPLFPFQSRVDTWVEGLRSRELDRDVALLATQSNKPSTLRQFQSGWKQLERYFSRIHLRREDVSVASVANFLGRQFLDEGLATSTVLNHYYACIKPFRSRFNLNLDSDENIKDLISAMKKVRPGQRGVSLFLKWSLQGLLDFLN